MVLKMGNLGVRQYQMQPLAAFNPFHVGFYLKKPY
jgi:hypothetical protein